MKKSVALLILGTVLQWIPGGNGIMAQTPPQFMGSLIYSPVLVQGYYGSWEAYSVFLPYVFNHDEIFYMFYTGMNTPGISSIGLATSTDGYDFDKFQQNPILTPSSSGFDSYMVARGVVIEDPSGWVMYYGARNLTGYGPGPYVGRATATDLTGPWTKDPDPVITVGSPDEWDNGFIEADNVFPLETGGFIMFYSAGDFMTSINFQIGMATSPDGITWSKYDDPLTFMPPYAESDPVLKYGDVNDWDGKFIWLPSALKKENGYEMYYTGCSYIDTWGIGYATSPDGITWTKYADNPIYTLEDDPYALENGYFAIESPSVVINGLTAFMYIDYGNPGVIGMATADLTGVGDQSAVGSRQSSVVSCYPNPAQGSSRFAVRSSREGYVTLKIYDVQGREIAVLVDENLPPGEHTVSFDMSGLKAGIYLYRLAVGGQQSAVSGKLMKY
jgi:hypothetical protein